MPNSIPKESRPEHQLRGDESPCQSTPAPAGRVVGERVVGELIVETPVLAATGFIIGLAARARLPAGSPQIALLALFIAVSIAAWDHLAAKRVIKLDPRERRLVAWRRAIVPTLFFVAAALLHPSELDARASTPTDSIVRLQGRVASRVWKTTRGVHRTPWLEYSLQTRDRIVHVRVRMKSGDVPRRELRIGDPVEVSGRLEQDRQVPTLTATSPLAVRSASQSSPAWRRFFLAIRSQVTVRIDALFGEYAGLFHSLLTGDRRGLDPEFRAALTDTGTYHFLAISGLHVGILCVVLSRFPFREKMNAAIKLSFLICFVFVSGAAAPVVRAALMMSLFWLCALSGRRPNALNTLCICAILLLAYDPRLLNTLGFQLSFCAVLGILLWAKRLSHDPLNKYRLTRRSRAQRFRDSFAKTLAASFAAGAATTPLIAHTFGVWHPWSALLSVIFLPIAAATLACGFLAVLAHFVFGAFAASFLAAASRCLSGALVDAVQLASQLPGVSLPIIPPSKFETMLGLLLLIVPLGFRSWRAAITVQIVVLVSISFASLRNPPPGIIHFDVGDGSASLLRLPEDHGQVLIDAGARSPFEVKRLSLMLRRSGCRRLSGLLLTHAHSDHAGAATQIIDEFQPRVLWISEYFGHSNPGRRIVEHARLSDLHVVLVSRGDRLRWPSTTTPVTIEIVHPQREESLPFVAKANESSLCALVRVGDRRILFAGDIEEAGTARLLQHGKLNADILVVPHHGRACARLEDLVARVQPQTLVISGRGGGGAVENADRFRFQGLEVFATWEGGSIENRWENSAWSNTHLRLSN